VNFALFILNETSNKNNYCFHLLLFFGNLYITSAEKKREVKSHKATHQTCWVTAILSAAERLNISALIKIYKGKLCSCYLPQAAFL
jgi:hypothetical protein